MAGERVERRLSAIFAGDVVGYSRLMEKDEEGTLARLNAHRREFFDPTIAQNRGRIVKRTGDGVLIEFVSAVDAARCAVDIQRGMGERNAGVQPDERIELRIGIHVGDIMIEDEDIFGDGVNIAARLEGIAQPGGVCISDDAYRQVRGKIDVTFQDSGEQELKNIARPVRVYQVRPDAPAAAAKPAAGGLTLPDKPSIAVLAFQNMSGDAEQEFFADGIAEDIITALSKAHWLFVIARNSSFSYKGKLVDVREVGRDLGVRYVLEGSVRKAGNRVRITAQLIDATSGHHVWAERYDRALEDIFAVQDEITHSIIGAIAPGIVAAEIQRTHGKDAAQLGQWERVMRAHWHVWRFTRDDCVEGFHLIEDALKTDPKNALALADLSFNWHFGGLFGWTREPTAIAMEKQGEAARLAIAAQDSDAMAQTALAVHELFSNLHDDAIRRITHATELDPNSSLARGYLGTALSFGGEPDRSLAAIEDAKRLSPRDYLKVVWHTVAAWSHLHAERFAEAIACAKQAIEFNPAFPDSHGILAAAAAHLGWSTDAKAGLAQVFRIKRALTEARLAMSAHGT
jgi:adenylate cyclase